MLAQLEDAHFVLCITKERIICIIIIHLQAYPDSATPIALVRNLPYEGPS
jgi:hypothetical protein